MARSASGTQSRMLGRYREKIVAANKNELNFRLAVSVFFVNDDENDDKNDKNILNYRRRD